MNTDMSASEHPRTRNEQLAAQMSARDLLRALRACKPGAPQLAALATEARVRAMIHDDAAVALPVIAKCRDLPALREAYRRERAGERRAGRLARIEARGRAVFADAGQARSRQVAADMQQAVRETRQWLRRQGYRTVPDGDEPGVPEPGTASGGVQP